MKKYIKSNYGGAFDIDPEMFWTKDDLVELGEEVELILKDRNYNVDCQECYAEPDNSVELVFYDRDLEIEVTSIINIDMRRIQSPSDLVKKYAQKFADDIEAQLDEAAEDIIPRF